MGEQQKVQHDLIKETENGETDRLKDSKPNQNTISIDRDPYSVIVIARLSLYLE
jgi:hypothetical protein